MILKAKQSFNQLKDEAKSHGAKLGFFIASLNISDEDKEAILTVLPKMSLEQLDRFIAILEAQYEQQETKGLDDNFKQELQSIKDIYDKDMKEIDDSTIKEIDELISKIS